MMTRRIPPPEQNPDGTRKSAEQRRLERQNAESQRRQAERQQPKQPAPSLPPPMPYEQRKAMRQAEHIGKQIAAEEQAKIAKAAAGPVNPYAARVRELQDETWRGPGTRRRLERMTALAEKWDSDRAAEQEAAERKAVIDNDPMVKNARDYAAGLVKLAPEQFQSEAAEIKGIADSGDAALAWSKMRDLEQRIWQHQDRIATEKRESKAVTDHDFQAAAVAAEDAKARFEHAAEMSPIPIPTV